MSIIGMYYFHLGVFGMLLGPATAYAIIYIIEQIIISTTNWEKRCEAIQRRLTKHESALIE